MGALKDFDVECPRCGESVRVAISAVTTRIGDAKFRTLSVDLVTRVAPHVCADIAEELDA